MYLKKIVVFFLGIGFNIYNINSGCNSCKVNKSNGNSNSEGNAGKESILPKPPVKLGYKPKHMQPNTTDMKPELFFKNHLDKKKSTKTQVSKTGNEEIKNNKTTKDVKYKKIKKNNIEEKSNPSINNNNNKVNNKPLVENDIKEKVNVDKKSKEDIINNKSNNEVKTQEQKIKEGNEKEDDKTDEEKKNEETKENVGIIIIKNGGNEITSKVKEIKKSDKEEIVFPFIHEKYRDDNSLIIYEVEKNIYSNINTSSTITFIHNGENITELDIPFFLAAFTISMNGNKYYYILFYHNSQGILDLFFCSEQDKKYDFENIKLILISNITSFDTMFARSNIKSINILNSFNTKCVGSMNMMFYECEKLKTITNLKFLDTSNVKQMSAMFHGCIELEEIDISCWDAKKIIHMDQMFKKCSKLKILKLPRYINENPIMNNIFNECKELQVLDLIFLNHIRPDINITKNEFSKLQTLYLDDSNFKNIEINFKELTSLETVYIFFNKTATEKDKNEILEQLKKNNFEANTDLTLYELPDKNKVPITEFIKKNN